jgi:glycosyltransferase involved in cell wall biosynthesis
MNVSVVIPVYNKAPFLKQAIESARALTEAGEIIVIDDGSIDGSSEIVVAQAAHDPRVRFLHHPGNRKCGISRSRNLGIREARFELISFLDGDDFYYPNRFQHSLSFLRSHTAVDAVFEPVEVVVASNAAQTEWNRETFFWPVRGGNDPDRLIYEMLAGITHIWQVNGFTARTEAVRRIGGFPNGINNGEDNYLFMRLAMLGTVRAAQLEAPVAAYRRSTINIWKPSPLEDCLRDILISLGVVWSLRGDLRATKIGPIRWKQLRSGFRSQLLSSLNRLRREDHRLYIALVFLLSMLTYPSLATDRRILANACYGVLGKRMPD